MTKNPNGSGTDPVRPIAAYLPDSQIDPRLDAEIRELLCRCFTAPEHARFRTQRFFYDPYPHRWVLKAEEGHLIGHAGIHDRELRTGSAIYPCAGIADVCVAPAFRGRGLLKQLLAEVHRWLRQRGCAFSVLFGEEPIYRSSGYRRVNLFLELPPAGLPQPLPALVHPLGNIDWPAEPPHLSGGLF